MKNELLIIFIISLYICFLLPFILFSSIILIFLELFEIFKNIKENVKRKLKSYWVSITLLFFSIYFPKNIYLSFDPKILNKKRVILLSNHITYFDWLFILNIINRFNLLNNSKFTMKYSIKKIPILGFILKYLGNIFLKRNWNSDKDILNSHLKKMNKNEFCIIIFPEGTFLDLEAKKDLNNFINKYNSNKYNNKIKEPSFTLLPKKKGFKKIYNYINKDLDLIIDFTLISKPFKEFPADFFNFRNIFLKRESYKLSVLIDSYELINEETFLNEIFKKKEIFLKKYSIIKDEENLAEFAKNIYSLTNNNYYYQSISLFSWNGVFNYLLFLLFMGFIIFI